MTAPALETLAAGDGREAEDEDEDDEEGRREKAGRDGGELTSAVRETALPWSAAVEGNDERRPCGDPTSACRRGDRDQVAMCVLSLCSNQRAPGDDSGRLNDSVCMTASRKETARYTVCERMTREGGQQQFSVHI